MQFINLKKVVAPLAFALSLGLGGAAHAKIKAATATGEAAIIDGDKSEALKQAKKDAMRKVIEKAGGVSVVSQTIVQNFQLVSDEIVTNARGAIVEPQWGKPRYKDGVAAIDLTAKVVPEKLEDAICSVVKANTDPKVTIIMVEKVGDANQAFASGTGVRGPLEQKVTEHFLDNCFTLVESGVKVTATSDGDFTKEQMDKIVKNVRADYAVFGKGWVIDNGPVIKNSPLKNYSLGVDLRLINLETGEIEVAASDSTQGLGALNAGQAVKNRAARYKDNYEDEEKAGQPKAFTRGGCPASSDGVVDCAVGGLYAKIAAEWQNQMVNANKIEVEVRGVKNYALAKSFRTGVEKQIKGSKVTQKKLKSGTAFLDVELEGGADRLAAEIDGKKYGKGRVEVLEVVRGRVILELK